MNSIGTHIDLQRQFGVARKATHVSVIIPAYNEMKRIGPTLHAMSTFLSDTFSHYEIVVADDGSTDDTVTFVEDLHIPYCRVLRAEQNKGKGSAVRRGLLAARGDYVLFADADNSTPIEEVESLLEKITDEGYDVAIGSRAADGAQVKEKSWLRQALSDGLNKLVNMAFNLNVKDTQCGFKLFTREAARTLASAQTIDGFSFDMELLVLAKKAGYRVAEVAVKWIDAAGSKVEPVKEIGRFIRDMALIKWNAWRGTYRAALVPADGLHVAMVTAFPPGQQSLNEHAWHFVRHLRRKEEISAITLLTDEVESPATLPAWHEDGIAVEIRPTWRFDSVANLFRILRTVRQTKPDLVLFNLQFATFSGKKIAGGLGLLTPWLTRLMGFRSMVLLHNIVETVDLKDAGYASNPLIERFIRTSATLLTRCLLQADLVALTIPRYVQTFRTKYNAKNVVWLPHGTFDQMLMPSFDTQHKRQQILTFGKFGTYKRVEGLIEAFESIQQRSAEQLELVIAGADSPNAPGYLAGIQQQYAHVKNVRFTGYVAEHDVPTLFRDAAMVVFPYTSTTGSSGVLHQAGSFGNAVVLPQIGDFIDLIESEGYRGEVFDPAQTDSLATAIQRLIDSPQRRAELGRQNFMASQGLPLYDVLDMYVLHMQKLVNRSRPQPTAAVQSLSLPVAELIMQEKRHQVAFQQAALVNTKLQSSRMLFVPTGKRLSQSLSA